TRAAHALVARAGERADALVEGLFRAYFEQARDIGEAGELVAIAAAAGLDAVEASACLAAREGFEAIAAAERDAARLGIGGVPFFVFGGRWAVSGAQEAVTLGAALDEAAARAGARGA
ncbi:MAG: DsbA family protein, partial [Proteobacteria bacterium]|nr:DsbA family protein [Pseudomonadota bacterium]